MDRFARPLRIARVAEALYAVIALALGIAMPFPPRGGALPTFVHWVGSGLLALAVTWRLGRPNRAVWAIAAILCAYVLINAINALIQVARFLARPSTFVGISFGIGVVIVVLQLTVAACLYVARDLRR